MEIRILLACVIVTGLVPLSVWADVNDKEHGRSLEEVVQEILEVQGVTSTDEIDCERVTDEQSEELGDAVMSSMMGTGEQHERMDEMMGGEGSESLRAMHIHMGQRYLGCASDSFDPMGNMGGMMSGGMMNGMMNMMGGMTPLRPSGFAGQVGGMMGPLAFAGLGIGSILLFWIVVIVGIVLLIKWVVSTQGSGQQGKTALDVLKECYAKGEIDKKEFEEKKKDLAS